MTEKKTEKKVTKKVAAPKPTAVPITTLLKDEHIVLYPYMTEKVVRSGLENKIAFIVARRATKSQVKQALSNLYSVKVASVNMEIAPDGKKKAYITLAKDSSATELATRLGML